MNHQNSVAGPLLDDGYHSCSSANSAKIAAATIRIG
jgi:hypothetical protein